MKNDVYMPVEIAVGIFDYDSRRTGFITYRYKDRGWISQTIVKRLTGYLPSKQKDPQT